MKKAIPFLFAAACLYLFPGCEEKRATPPANNTTSGNPLTAPVDYIGAVGKAQISAKKTISTLGLDQAIKQFQIDEGRMPKDLNELVSKGTIGQIPPAPVGMKYDYDAKTGVIKVVPQ